MRAATLDPNTGLGEHLTASGAATSLGVEANARQGRGHGFHVTPTADAMTGLIDPRLGGTGTTREISGPLGNARA